MILQALKRECTSRDAKKGHLEGDGVLVRGKIIKVVERGKREKMDGEYSCGEN